MNLPPATIAPELFRKWRAATRGMGNPHPMTNPVWQWLVETRISAYEATDAFGGASGCDSGPGWCFARYGQSETTLPDGRTVFVAGEHEDHYDPDFFIYNDVVIVSPDTNSEILGYSIELFPPTDFHSATLVGDRIVMIGCLGYPPDRRSGITQVLTLDCADWHIERIETHEQGPGWLHEHRAQLSPDGQSIILQGGRIDRCDGEELVENIDDWRLWLREWRWERLTTRRWQRFEVHRTDRKMLHLWDMGRALWSKSVGWDDFEPSVERLRKELGGTPRLDILPELYRPDLAHVVLPEDEHDHRMHRIRVGAILVRYAEDMFTIQVTVEGQLASDDLARLRSDLIASLEALEQSPIAYREI